MNKFSHRPENTRVFSSNRPFGHKFASFGRVAHHIISQPLAFSNVPIVVILRCETACFSL